MALTTQGNRVRLFVEHGVAGVNSCGGFREAAAVWIGVIGMIFNGRMGLAYGGERVSLVCRVGGELWGSWLSYERRRRMVGQDARFGQVGCIAKRAVLGVIFGLGVLIGVPQI